MECQICSALSAAHDLAISGYRGALLVLEDARARMKRSGSGPEEIDAHRSAVTGAATARNRVEQAWQDLKRHAENHEREASGRA